MERKMEKMGKKEKGKKDTLHSPLPAAVCRQVSIPLLSLSPTQQMLSTAPVNNFSLFAYPGRKVLAYRAVV